MENNPLYYKSPKFRTESTTDLMLDGGVHAVLHVSKLDPISPFSFLQRPKKVKKIHTSGAGHSRYDACIPTDIVGKCRTSPWTRGCFSCPGAWRTLP